MFKVYKSKIGIELSIPLLLIFSGSSVVMFMNEEYQNMVFILIISIFIIYLFLNTKYTISGTILNVKNSFILNQDISISSIKKIRETYNPLSAPATSIDRIEIFYEKYDSILISPKDKKAFIAHLLKINPSIEVQMRKK